MTGIGHGSTITGDQLDQIAANDSRASGHALASAFRAQTTSDDPHDPWRFLADIFDIRLLPSNPNEPFAPMLERGDKRSMVPSDITDEQVSFLRNLLDDATCPVVRCRLGDVLWTARRDGKAGNEAVRAYIATGRLLEDPDDWSLCMEHYERAVRLALSLGSK